ncbi:DUF1634 domain-containing protein [Lentilactobacillus sp. Marseille-Q4993]|uniref:DUF1634 domain-containing protein n=1 Tax=Lentilactobacillus sp. Marseille-Q4993 TaxID=3039492 RepID=UPI0024BCF245|nr:DUF1634 domain-containing protein [Lentilactobacillus sp. Marseille-Q4993]
MNDKQKNVSEEMNDVEMIIGKILRIGVIISAVVMGIGLILLFVTQTTGYPANTFPDTFRSIFTGTIALKPYAIMMFGVFLLILTPILRVVVSIYSFWVEGDKLYVIITTIVLVILAISFVFGIVTR